MSCTARPNSLAIGNTQDRPQRPKLSFHIICLNLSGIDRKQSGIQSGLGAAETKLLYTLHWILMDCAEECADADFEKRINHASSFHFLFPIATVTVRTTESSPKLGWDILSLLFDQT